MGTSTKIAYFITMLTLFDQITPTSNHTRWGVREDGQEVANLYGNAGEGGGTGIGIGLEG